MFTNDNYLDYLLLMQELGHTLPDEIQRVVKNDEKKIKRRKIYIPDATIRHYNYRRESDNGENNVNGGESESDEKTDKKTTASAKFTKKKTGKTERERSDSESESEVETVYI